MLCCTSTRLIFYELSCRPPHTVTPRVDDIPRRVRSGPVPPAAESETRRGGDASSTCVTGTSDGRSARDGDDFSGQDTSETKRGRAAGRSSATTTTTTVTTITSSRRSV